MPRGQAGRSRQSRPRPAIPDQSRSGWGGRPVDDDGAMLRAIQLARDGMAAGEGGPFGAVVVRDGAIVGEGVNRATSTNDPTAHAEIVAIRDACARLGQFSLNGCTVVSSCEACPMCLGAILWSRSAALVYGASREDAAAGGFDDADFYEEVALPAGRRRLPTRRAGATAAARLFGEWLAKADRQAY